MIKRMLVDEGFLDGLHLEFRPGLNVIIGARGTGKTSVIELLRYALSAPAFTEQTEASARQHAVGVLAGGRVEVQVEEDGDTTVVSRQAQDAETTSGPSARVTVLAQKELEAVAGQASGRMRLIDRLIPDLAIHSRTQARLEAELRSMTVELKGLLAEGMQLASALEDMGADQAALLEARAHQQRLLASVAATQDDQQGLVALQAQGAQLAATDQRLSRALAEVTEYLSVVQRARRRPTIEDSDDLQDELRLVGRELDEAERNFMLGQNHLEAALGRLQALAQQNAQTRTSVEDRVRLIRGRLETLQQGASDVTRRVAALEEQEAQRNAIRTRIEERRHAFRTLFDLRQSRYRELDEVRNRRYEMRRQRIEDLSSELAPSVIIELTRSAITDSYTSAIITCLRGSGIHYRSLAPLLATSMSPLELVEATELGDADAISNGTGITLERASAVVAALRNANLELLISVDVDDSVDFLLLDGSEYKATGQLSIGQRCTVVLPVLLADHGDVLVIDQPEDHLDNAFIADTLVPGLLRRGPYDQIILTSHNANIPVLGEADQVIVMRSDGRRGFAEYAGDLSSPSTVKAIERVMEGGREAFARRAAFYGTSL